jgi:hypothetical protein
MVLARERDGADPGGDRRQARSPGGSRRIGKRPLVAEVAIAAQPEEGRKLFESFLEISNKHVAWILRENLKKNRLKRMDPEWVGRMRAAVG